MIFENIDKAIAEKAKVCEDNTYGARIIESQILKGMEMAREMISDELANLDLSKIEGTGTEQFARLTIAGIMTLRKRLVASGDRIARQQKTIAKLRAGSIGELEFIELDKETHGGNVMGCMETPMNNVSGFKQVTVKLTNYGLGFFCDGRLFIALETNMLGLLAEALKADKVAVK